jgi:hypothetical protein
VKFFVPEWDDRVDPGYDFETDSFSLKRDPYHDDVYAHELFSDHPYDGVLVSRMALGESGPKRDMVGTIGMRRYLRLPDGIELLGDCGAFGYIADKDPRFRTDDVINYYHQLGFDYGVSVDHLIVTEFASESEYRYQLTLRNAEEFRQRHQQGGFQFTPIGAVQGWDARSYVEAADAVVAMGYDYIALGGLARSNTGIVREVVTAVRRAIPRRVRVHVFGVARLALLPLFRELEITSIDSAAPLRQAWLSAKDNYYAEDRTYAAIRVPVADPDKELLYPEVQVLFDAPQPDRREKLAAGSGAGTPVMRAAEKAALKALRAYDRREAKMRDVMDAVMAYDDLLKTRKYGNNRKQRVELYEETLRDRPWKRCPCAICRALGIEVIIFRGNNRNRRRGFHNLWVVRRRIERLTLSGRPTVCKSEAECTMTYPLPLP